MTPPPAAAPDPRQRFSDRVGDYVRYRPGYPAAAVDLVARRAGIGEGSPVADIGSGTGIFTGLLLATGATVFAVEPNDAMRAAAESALGGRANFRSIRGSAEETGLPAQSVGLVTCAQAFHWFDVPRARREFARILTPGGWCALVWNSAQVGDSAFARGYEAIKEAYGRDFQRVRHEGRVRDERCDQLYGAGRWELRSFASAQHLDLEALKGRLLSSSYAPKEGEPAHAPMMASLARLFDETQIQGRVTMT
jgi:SAM-dependent methyltransferase